METARENLRIMERDYIKDLLSEGICTVTFTKINGEKRVMDCTLDQSIIPEEKSPKNAKEKNNININVLAAFDINKNDWRSFRIDNVESVKRS